MDNDNRGFWIYGRNPVHIYLNGPKISIDQNYTSYGFFEFHKIMTQVGRNIMINWCPDRRTPEMGVRGRAKLTDWAVLQTKKALAKRVKAAWLEILKKADPIQLSVHRAVFAASASCSEAIKQENLYRKENCFLISDILKFRAAVLASYHFETFDPLFSPLTSSDFNNNWAKYYAPNSEIYPTLQKMLPNLPGGIPQWQVPNFTFYRFERPIYDRLELLTVLGSRQNSRNPHIFMHAKRADIKRAIARVAEHRRIQPNFRKTNSIVEAITFIDDFPEKHNGNVVGLAEKSCRWHRENNFSNLKHSKYSLNHQTARPPIPLPADSHIKFLGSVGEVAEEAENMKHCIFGYVEGAIRGEYYLFRTDYQGDSASTQVMRDGRVAQSRGFRNSENKATAYSRRVLSKWGRALAELSPVGVANEDELPF